ncbi:hypothetical protein GCM10027578_06170 [Spirosoma luteolum]
MENNPDQPTDPQPGHRPGTDPAKRLPEQSRSFVQYSGIAFQMLGTIGLGVFVGLKIDEWQQNARPIWTIVLSLTAIGASLYLFIKQLTR